MGLIFWIDVLLFNLIDFSSGSLSCFIFALSVVIHLTTTVAAGTICRAFLKTHIFHIPFLFYNLGSIVYCFGLPAFSSGFHGFVFSVVQHVPMYFLSQQVCYEFTESANCDNFSVVKVFLVWYHQQFQSL